MRERRVALRKRSRLLVRFGRTATFTIDVGGGGFLLGAMQVLPINSSVEGSIQVDGVQVPFSGRVAWISPGDRRIHLSGTMGVSFTDAFPELGRLVGLQGAPLLRGGGT